MSQTTMIWSSRVRHLIVGLSAAGLFSLAGIAGNASASVSGTAAPTPSPSSVAAKPPTDRMFRTPGRIGGTRGQAQRRHRTKRAATSYDYGRIETDSNAAVIFGGSPDRELHLNLLGDPRIRSLNGGYQWVALQTNLVNSGGGKYYGRWHFAYTTPSGYLHPFFQNPVGTYVALTADTRTPVRSFAESTAWSIRTGANPRYSHRLQLRVVWYAGNTIQRDTTVNVSIRGQDGYWI